MTEPVEDSRTEPVDESEVWRTPDEDLPKLTTDQLCWLICKLRDHNLDLLIELNEDVPAMRAELLKLAATALKEASLAYEFGASTASRLPSPGRQIAGRAMTDPIKALLDSAAEDKEELKWWLVYRMADFVDELEEAGMELEDIPKALADYAAWMQANLNLFQ
jgi:hypothetical protein